MSVRAVGVFLVLALAGVAAGYGVSSLDTTEPMTISVAAPVPGESPSYPVNEYDVEQDPDDPALAPDVPLVETTIRGNGKRLRAEVPRGWTAGGELPTTTFSIPGSSPHTYRLRFVMLIGNRAPSVEVANRITALMSAETNGAMENVEVESEHEDEFVATYLEDGFQRVTMERFLTLGGTSAYATVAVVGREVDREGMADLLERVSASLRIP